MTLPRTTIRRVARETFAYDNLRPGQEPAIQAVLRGRDALVVLPTGSGKSAIYQIAGVLKPGPTVVVSPLIALQYDQLQALSEQDVGGAAALNSTLRVAARSELLSGLQAGDLEFILLAPEQLVKPEVIAALQAARPSLFVVDEAHCVSEWGHDFRPDYLRLAGAIESLGHPTVLALTATASPPVRAAIVEALGMRDPAMIVQGFDRPNIALEVCRFDDEFGKRRALLERVAAAAPPGIIYVATRREAEEIAGLLREAGIAAAAYHAGMRAADRESAQERFMADEIAVIVATTAFGMGIDKANVRFVFHYNISESVDAYYQEIGRAGRDGQPAAATLFYNPEDLNLRRFFASGGGLDEAELTAVVRALRRRRKPTDAAALGGRLELSQSRLLLALRAFEAVGALAIGAGDVITWTGRLDSAAAIERAATHLANQRQFDRSRVAMMQAYAETRECRRAFILTYFGEAVAPFCGNCDICASNAAPAAERERGGADHPFAPGSRVEHRLWGAGQVLRYHDGAMTVLFDRVGYKTLALDLVLSENLLSPAIHEGPGSTAAA